MGFRCCSTSSSSVITETPKIDSSLPLGTNDTKMRNLHSNSQIEGDKRVDKDVDSNDEEEIKIMRTTITSPCKNELAIETASLTEQIDAKSVGSETKQQNLIDNQSERQSLQQKDNNPIPSLSTSNLSSIQQTFDASMTSIKDLFLTNQEQEENLEESSSSPPPPKGISVYYLGTVFLDEVKTYGKNPISSTIYDIEDLRNEDQNGLIRQKGESTICPHDGQIGAAYVDCLDNKALDHVGVANYMLSYTWGNTIQDIVDTLSSVCTDHKLDPKRTYVWICCLCINQHRVIQNKKEGKVIPFETFQQKFQQQVLGINNMISLMTPWNKPLYLNRVWCVFELYTAIENNCRLIIAMPPREKETLIQFCTEKEGKDSNENLVDILNDRISTKIQYAEASVEEDWERIQIMVRDGPGFSPLNHAVNQKLRGWMKACLDDVLKEDETLCLNTNAFILLSEY